MEMNLIHKFVLLAIDQQKGKFLIDTLSLNYGIAGAILIELSEKEIIKIENKRVILAETKLTKSKIIDASVKLIQSAKTNRKIKYWINKIGNKSTVLKKLVLNDLSNDGMIRIEEKTFFFGWIKTYKYVLIKSKVAEELRINLRKIVLEGEKSDVESVLLLSLMNSCKLTRTLFKNKKENKLANKRIKELTKDIEVSNSVSQALSEIQSAVLVATTSAFIGSAST